MAYPPRRSQSQHQCGLELISENRKYGFCGLNVLIWFKWGACGKTCVLTEVLSMLHPPSSFPRYSWQQALLSNIYRLKRCECSWKDVAVSSDMLPVMAIWQEMGRVRRGWRATKVLRCNRTRAAVITEQNTESWGRPRQLMYDRGVLSAEEEIQDRLGFEQERHASCHQNESGRHTIQNLSTIRANK